MYHVYLICTPVSWLAYVQVFEHQWTEQEVEVLDFGHTGKWSNGYLLLELEGAPQPSLLSYLQSEVSILEYAVVSVPAPQDSYPFGMPFPHPAKGGACHE